MNLRALRTLKREASTHDIHNSPAPPAAPTPYWTGGGGFARETRLAR